MRRGIGRSSGSFLLSPVSFPAPAKLNLDLRVGPPRADGFHPIRSWFVTAGLFDTLRFEPADELRLSCSDPTIPADARNLVWRAAEAMRSAAAGGSITAGRGGPGVAITLTKRIPAGGGLGGGSSDAATTLLALDRLWNLGLGPDRLHAIAAALGSDVPFFLHGPSSVCTGRGDVVTPEPPPTCRWALLLLPGIVMPTPAVFRKLDEQRRGGDGGFSAADDVASPAADAAGLLARLVNDLEAPAFALSPGLARLRDDAEAAVGRPVRMSGSGSTLFTLADSDADVRMLQSRVPAGAASACVRIACE